MLKSRKFEITERSLKNKEVSATQNNDLINTMNEDAFRSKYDDIQSPNESFSPGSSGDSSPMISLPASPVMKRKIKLEEKVAQKADSSLSLSDYNKAKLNDQISNIADAEEYDVYREQFLQANNESIEMRNPQKKSLLSKRNAAVDYGDEYVVSKGNRDVTTPEGKSEMVKMLKAQQNQISKLKQIVSKTKPDMKVMNHNIQSPSVNDMSYSDDDSNVNEEFRSRTQSDVADEQVIDPFKPVLKKPSRNDSVYNQTQVNAGKPNNVLMDHNGNNVIVIPKKINVLAILNGELNATRLINVYEYLRAKWGMTSDMVKMIAIEGGVKQYASLWSNFIDDYRKVDYDQVKKKYKENMRELMTLMSVLHRATQDQYGRAFADLEITVPKMIKVCEASFESLLGLLKVQEYCNPTSYVPASFKHLMKEQDAIGKNEKQRILFRMFYYLSRDRYRCLEEECWEEIKTPEGYMTHAFKKVCTMDEYIAMHSDRYLDPDNWAYLYGSSNCKGKKEDLIYSISTNNDVDFPKILISRHKFSFRNGIFVTKVPIGKEYNHKTRRYDQKYTCKFYKYDDEEILKLNHEECSSKYFDKEFVEYDEEMDWWHIPTPCLQSIFDYQFGSRSDCEDISRMIYVLIGRMLYNRGDLDNWEIIPFIQGVGGSGKSTITKNVLKEFYNPQQIAEIDNKLERQFGLGPLAVKNPFITIGDELDEACQLDLTQFLKMVSGETITAAIKRGTPLYLQWPSHLWFSGNQLPPWEDKGGALSRRIVTIFYKQLVRSQDKDMSLGERIKDEIPNIMQKCVKAYLELVNKHSNDDFWSFCPEYFKESKGELQRISNVMRSFFESDEVVFDKSGLILESEFLSRLKMFAESQSVKLGSSAIRHKSFSINNIVQQINDARGNNDLTYEKRSVNVNGKHYNKVMCIFGIRFRTEEDDEEGADSNNNARRIYPTDVVVTNHNMSRASQSQNNNQTVLLNGSDNPSNNKKGSLRGRPTRSGSTSNTGSLRGTKKGLSSSNTQEDVQVLDLAFDM